MNSSSEWMHRGYACTCMIARVDCIYLSFEEVLLILGFKVCKTGCFPALAVTYFSLSRLRRIEMDMTHVMISIHVCRSYDAFNWIFWGHWQVSGFSWGSRISIIHIMRLIPICCIISLYNELPYIDPAYKYTQIFPAMHAVCIDWNDPSICACAVTSKYQRRSRPVPQRNSWWISLIIEAETEQNHPWREVLGDTKVSWSTIKSCSQICL